MNNLKSKIYQIIDLFLVEAKNLDGKDRSLKQLNQDRHSVAGEIEKLIYSIRDDLLAIADQGEYEDLRREVECYFKNYEKISL